MGSIRQTYLFALILALPCAAPATAQEVRGEVVGSAAAESTDSEATATEDAAELAPPMGAGAPSDAATPDGDAIGTDAANASAPTDVDATVAGELATEPADEQTDDFMVRGTLQLEAREFGDAARTLAEGVAEMERALPRYDAALARPLTLLGDAQFGEGEFAAAEETYGRAIHITRVNEGLHSPAQIPIVYKEADTMAAQGKLDAANGRQEYAYETLRRAYGPASEALVPGMYALAAWYKRTHNIYSARELYALAAETLARVHGPDSPELVLPLRGVAETFRQERFPPYIAPSKREAFTVGTAAYSNQVAAERTLVVNRYSEGERALGEIIRILNQDPDTPRLDVVLAILDLADWHLLFEKYSRAFELYGRVQALMVEDAGLTTEDIERYFGQPMPLYLPMPPNPDPPDPTLTVRATEGYVELGYTISDRGEVRDLETLASEPPGMMDIKVRRAMRVARFRPRFENGEPVATPLLKYRHRFVYYPAPEPPVHEPEASAGG